jgi:serine/threonine protein kinase
MDESKTESALFDSIPPGINERFENLSLIGSGGMGLVYRATDKSLNRTVALKLIQADKAKEIGFVKRFKREVLSMAALSHPNIVKVYDFEKSGDTVYFSMEFVKGCSLLEQIALKPLSNADAKKVIEGSARGLAAVHEAGLIHRDIKPGNIMVADDGVPKIMDFGLVRFSKEYDLTTLTRTQDLVGTILYMPPEIFVGESHDASSDIYQLGVTFYECLTSKRPLTVEEISLFAYGGTPSLLPPSAHNPLVDEHLDAIVMKAMALDRKERFQSANEIIVALQERPLSKVAPTVTVSPSKEKAVTPKARTYFYLTLALFGLLFLAMLSSDSQNGGKDSSTSLLSLAHKASQTDQNVAALEAFLEVLSRQPRAMDESVQKELYALFPEHSPPALMIRAHTSHDDDRRRDHLFAAIDSSRDKLSDQGMKMNPNALLFETALVSTAAHYSLRRGSATERELMNIEELVSGSSEFLHSLSVEVRTDWPATYHRAVLHLIRAEALARHTSKNAKDSLYDMDMGLVYRCHIELVPQEYDQKLKKRLYRLDAILSSQEGKDISAQLNKAKRLLGNGEKKAWRKCAELALAEQQKALAGFDRESGHAVIITSVLKQETKRAIHRHLREHRRAFWQLSALCERMGEESETRKETVFLALEIMASPERQRLAEFYAKGHWGIGFTPLKLAQFALHQCEVAFLTAGTAKERTHMIYAIIRFQDRVCQYLPARAYLVDRLIKLIGEDEPLSLLLRARVNKAFKRPRKAHKIAKLAFNKIRNLLKDKVPTEDMGLLLYQSCAERFGLEIKKAPVRRQMKSWIGLRGSFHCPQKRSGNVPYGLWLFPIA